MTDTTRLDDGAVLRVPHNGEIIRVAQNDGLDGEIRLQYHSREGSPTETLPFEVVAKTAETEGWEYVTGGCVPDHAWGKASGSTPCPECGKFIGAEKSMEWEHRSPHGRYAGGFVPVLRCNSYDCDGEVSFEEMQERGLWTPLDELADD